MERYEFEMIPVPTEALIAAGIVPGVTVEAFADGSRIVIQKAPEDATRFAKPTMKTVKAVLTAAPAAANA